MTDMTFQEWRKLYNEALDCRDWLSCDVLAENFPDHCDLFFQEEEAMVDE